MVRYCCVPHCTSDATTKKSFHFFPKDEPRLQDWKDRLGIDRDVTPNMCVCSDHFLPQDYFKIPGYVHIRRHLKKTAVPSLNLPGTSTSVSNNRGRGSYFKPVDRSRKRQMGSSTRKQTPTTTRKSTVPDEDESQFFNWQKELKDLENRNIALLAELNKLCKESDPLYGFFG